MPERIIVLPLREGMQKNFVDYAMSVVTGRALPDVRDGLKPVHRRIIYDMGLLGLTPDKAYKKAARIVGDVLGKFHPHGDASVYDAAVVLAQDFATNHTIVDGHGNWGSVDGDAAAAMRYTEARMTRYGLELLRDIKKNTVDFVPNFDGEEEEPTVLPTLIPNLLVNGAFGIAVGMGTNIPPHNLNEVYDAVNYIIDEILVGNEPTIDGILSHVTAPDFPTGGVIVGLSGIKEAYKTGNGKCIVRGKYDFESENGKTSIVISEIPYRVNKAKLVEAIAGLMKDQKDSKGNVKKKAVLGDIKEIRDESDKDGMRIVIELKKDANPKVVEKKLLKYTKLQSSFGMNLIALVNYEPVTLGIKEILEHFINHAADVITRRTAFDLDKAQKRLNIVDGILIAVNEKHNDAVIEIIRNADDPVATLIVNGFNKEQAEYIVEMKLKSLNKNAIAKFVEEKAELENDIAKWTAIVSDETVLLNQMKAEFLELKTKFGRGRKTVIEHDNAIDINEEDLINEEMLIVSVTSDNLVKAVEEKEYKTQGRGGKGVKAANTKNDEIVKYLLTVNSKEDILFFTNQGRCHVLKAYKIEKASRTARGKSINNYLNLNGDEYIVNVLTADTKDKTKDILFVTTLGIIKRLPLDQLSTRQSITRVVSFKENDSLKSALIVGPQDNVLITTALGKSIRIAMNAEGGKAIRPMGRTAAGVKGIELAEYDLVVDITIIDNDSTVFTITENGLGKRTAAKQWEVQGRGGKGIIAHKINEKTGCVVAATTVKDNDELFVATEQGQIVRINIDTISTFGRSTAGVKIMNLNEGDCIVSISKGNSEEDEQPES